MVLARHPRLLAHHRIIAVPILAIAGAAIGAALAASSDSTLLRLFAACLLLTIIGSLSLANFGAALTLTFVFLPLLGLTRRALIPVSSWTPLDPLLLVAPAGSLLFL